MLACGMEGGRHLRETIDSQPGLVARLLQDERAVTALAPRIEGARRIFLVGTGTSFHGALVGEHIFRSVGRDAWAVPAFEFVHFGPALREDDGLILISHRGSKRFSNQALEKFAKHSEAWLVVTGEGSAYQGDGVILTCPQEQSSVHTASHVGAMLRLAQLASAVATGDPAPWSPELRELPARIEAASQLRSAVAAVVRELDLSRPVHFLGAGPGWATAMEGALKLGEASYLSTVAHEIEGVLHGPILSIGKKQAVLVVASAGPSRARTQQVVAAFAAIGASIVVVGPASATVAGATWSLTTPEAPEVLAPLLNVVPLQWLAFEGARLVGVDPDTFRRTDPAYAASQEAAPL
ncbi:MAG: SIS domain-containing protein [Candidatus Dormibacteraeota bacterium]|nr:SIS domain-containing protein [Candidatus Dormibacteraeota bacterium]